MVVKSVAIALGVIAIVIAAAVAWMAGSAYVRAPKLVAELERSGALPFTPDQLSRERLCALLVVQDSTFYRHRGIGLAAGSPGHTTVTQAIGTWMLFDGFTPGRFRQRKVRLMIAALGLDAALPKETQLRLFLNRSYFGEEILGFPHAARAFFGKDLEDLSDAEFLRLLAMLDGPNRFHVIEQPEANAARVPMIREKVQRGCAAGCFEGAAPVPCDAPQARR